MVAFRNRNVNNSEQSSSIKKTSFKSLLCFNKEFIGNFSFNGPPKGGKTYLMSKIVEHVLQNNKTHEFTGVALLVPAEREGWADLSKQCQRAGIPLTVVKKREGKFLLNLLQAQKNLNKRKRKNKVLLIWDDQYGSIDMNVPPFDFLCKILAARSRQPEVNITWMIASHHSTFSASGVRNNMHGTAITNMHGQYLKDTLAFCPSFQSSIEEIEGELDEKHRFVLFDGFENKIYSIKA